MSSANRSESEVDELLDFVADYQTRNLDRQSASWMIDKLGRDKGNLLDLFDGQDRCVLAALFDGLGNPDGAAELFVLGYRATGSSEQRFGEALAWAQQRTSQTAVRRVEVSLPPSLAELAPLVQRSGYERSYDLLLMALDDIEASPWREFGPPPPLAWVSLSESNVEAAYDCYCRAFATVSGTQVTPLDEFRDMMLQAEQLPRVVLAEGRAIAYARVVWYDKKTRRGEVRIIARDPVAPQRGLGKVALAGALEQLKEMGATSVCLEVASDNERAVGLYRRFGFVTEERTSVYRREL